MSTPGSHVLELTDATFDAEVLASPVPVLVDFTAAWCAPCRVLAPHVAAVAADHAGALKVGACDVDRNVAVATRFHIRSMPTLVLFHHGQVAGQIIGAVPRSKIEALIARALEPAPASSGQVPTRSSMGT